MDEPKIETLYEGKFLRLRRNGRWEYVERIASPGAAFIVAVTQSRELVLVEQYRVPLQRRCIELPAGIIGDEDHFRHESVEESALRELEEETGFRGEHAELLTVGPVGAGLTSELLYLVRISGLCRAHEGGGVDGEDITVHCVPLDEVRQWLAHKAEERLLIDPRIYAALYFALHP